MVLVVSLNNKHYHSLTIMDSRFADSEAHTRETDVYAYEEAWVNPVSRAVLVLVVLIPKTHRLVSSLSYNHGK